MKSWNVHGKRTSKKSQANSVICGMTGSKCYKGGTQRESLDSRLLEVNHVI